MEKQYYSTHPEGLTSIISEILRKTSKTDKILHEGNSYILYTSTKKPEEIAQLKYLELSFLTVDFFTKNFKIPDLIKYTKNNTNKIIEISHHLAKKNSTFRIITSQSSTDKNNYNPDVKNLENLLSKNLKIDRGHPDYEIRLVEKNSYGFIGIRITKPAEYIDEFQKGSLRKEIAYILNYLSNPSQEDIFIDPFCGGGIIPILRSEMAQYKKIIASDMNTSLLKDKLIKTRMNIPNLIIESNELSSLNPENISVNKIVTDPPWGMMESVPNIQEFYKKMFLDFIRISRENTLIVLLSAQNNIIKNILKENSNILRLEKEIPIKASGRDTYIFVIKKSDKV